LSAQFLILGNRFVKVFYIKPSQCSEQGNRTGSIAGAGSGRYELSYFLESCLPVLRLRFRFSCSFSATDLTCSPANVDIKIRRSGSKCELNSLDSRLNPFPSVMLNWIPGGVLAVLRACNKAESEPCTSVAATLRTDWGETALLDLLVCRQRLVNAL
jgi:hypothetical protein